MIRVGLGFLALAALACGSASEGGEPRPTSSTSAAATGEVLPFALTPVQERGRAIFEAVCWTCHGTAARGDGPAVLAGASSAPPDLTSGKYAGLTTEQLHARFDTLSASASGDPRHPHMRFVLSFMDSTAFGAALSYIPALVYPSELPGSALAGRVLYERHCKPCHGASGDGRGPAADMLSIAPASFREDTLVASRAFQALKDKILQGGALLHGSPMPAWGMFFDERMAWDVVAYISSFQPGVLSPPPGR